MRLNPKLTKTVTAVVAVTVILSAIVIMSLQLGVVDGYDFGAGAYYYADIPSFEKMAIEDLYQTTIPLWVYITLFLVWGFLMYRLWGWIEKR